MSAAHSGTVIHFALLCLATVPCTSVLVYFPVLSAVPLPIVLALTPLQSCRPIYALFLHHFHRPFYDWRPHSIISWCYFCSRPWDLCDHDRTLADIRRLVMDFVKLQLFIALLKCKWSIKRVAFTNMESKNLNIMSVGYCVSGWLRRRVEIEL